MKSLLLSIAILLLGFSQMAGQETVDSVIVSKKEKPRPVRSPWESGILINHQTGYIAPKKTLESHIQHRFGAIENGISDVFGLMAPGANIRLGINYSIIDGLMVGFGTNSQKKYQDFQVKYQPFYQTRDNKIPLSVTLYGNAAIDARSEESFGLDYQFSDRLSYFAEAIVSRKFTEWLSVQASINWTHYNAQDPKLDHDKLGIGGAARFKFTPQSSIQVEFGIPLEIKKLSEQHNFSMGSKPHFSIGYEVATSTHAFQIFFTNSIGILPQEIYMFNTGEWDSESFRLGFNITRLWNF